MSNELDLDAIRARAGAATAGPWIAVRPDPECEDTAERWLTDCLADKTAKASDVLMTVWAPDEEGIALPCVTGDGPTSVVDADFIAHSRTDVPALLAEVERLQAENADLRENPRDEYHTMAEVYEYRMLYNAAAVNAWEWPTVKSWVHSDGEPCFDGGWFIVVATLPTGQVSNHYEAKHWDLFHIPEAVPPTYDGHTPQDAARRLWTELARHEPTA